MGLSRDDVLRELELLPVWRLRNQVVNPVAESADVPLPGQPEPDNAAAEGVEQLEATAENIAVSEVSANVAVTEPIAVDAPDVPAKHENVKPVQELAHEEVADIQVDPGYWESMQSSPEFADSAPLVVEEGPLVAKGDRRTAIMEMDWQALQQSVPECEACNLAETRAQTVFGVGDPNAEWLFVGEAPGAEEDRRGEPFVGTAGQLLDNMLAAIALKRDNNVYIANVLKCRPPANRDPHGEEVVQCDPYLKRQVELIKPKLIVALGKFAAQSLLASDGSIASLRGKLHDFHGVPVIVTYHPAYLLRNMPDKARAWDDLCFAREAMQSLQSAALPSSEG